jgi:hypothetical protein
MKFKQLREKYRSKFPSSLVSSAVKIALDMSGNMTGAYKKIEAMKKGLSKDKLVQDALRQANESVSEAVDRIEFPNMDDDSHATASMIAKKHGLKIVSKKGKIGNNLTVSGNSQKMSKFLKALPSESVNEGKYTAYSDLLLMKARIIDKEGPKSDKLPAVDSQIRIVMKRLGIKEGTEIQEGTWQTPKNKAELRKLMNLVAKPVFATKPSDIDKYMKQLPFGDDELYDDLESLFYAKDSDGKIARPIKNLNKFPKTDLNQVAMDSLNGRWLTAKKKGNGWDITHINFDFDEVEEAMKRKSGNIRPGKRMKVDLSAGKNY